ncbi:MAG: iron ABC transporter permease [Lachnospiraceae bacterium]|nr:iron ABC transporter permease [Lachnospiraceae bacterium]
MAAVAVFITAAALILCVGTGSVRILPGEILAVIKNKLFDAELPEQITQSMAAIIWEIRMPRVFTAFAVGAMLSVSGAVMQAILQNPLASSYTMGVSSGASLGAAVIIILEISIPLLLPGAAFACGLSTVFLVLAAASSLDGTLRNSTVILFGMILSLFVSAIVTMLSAAFSQHMQRMVLWQMGTFAGRRWTHAVGLLAAAAVGTLAVSLKHRELDVMSFGDEGAAAVGVESGREKKKLLVIASLLTALSVCFTGVIGFIDLAAPHAVRRIFGASHKYVIPMSGVIGGGFMALADMLSRTVLSPQEIPVGAVTALLGAPFFLWVYFGTRRRERE